MYTGDNNWALKNTEYTGGIHIGYVFKTQEELGEDTCVGFYLPRILPLVDATSGPVETTESVNTKIFANKISAPSSVPVTNYIKVKYNGRSNFSQPMIALGESAQLFFLNGDYKEPRYTDAHNDERRRKTDKFKIFVHSKDECDDGTKDSYYIELNSVDGKIQIHTGTENGEKHAYDFIINPSESTIIAQDDDGNVIGISTEDKLISLENSSGSYIKIEDKDINVKCDGDFIVDCDNYKVTAKTAVSEEAASKAEYKSGKITTKADSTIKMECSMLDITANAQTKATTPTFLVTGVLAAPTMGTCPSAGSPPTIQTSTVSGVTLTSMPKGVGAYGDKVMALFMSVIPCFGKLAGVASGIISPQAPQIPCPTVKL